MKRLLLKNFTERYRHGKRTLVAALSVLLTIVAQTGCGQTDVSALLERQSSEAGTHTPVSKESFYFDTVCQITVYDMDGADELDETSWEAAAQGVITEAFSLCREYEQILSKTKEGSDVWNINHAEGKPVLCDARTIELIRKGVYYGDLSQGAFDITIGRAEDLWDFHGESPSVPEAGELAEAVSHVDYTGIQTDEEAGTVQLADPEAEIDLGGIAKGYIADAVSERLEQEQVTAAIISLGGNIVCVGEKAADTPFCIGIETPYSDRTQIVGSAQVADGTVVTSGVYERFFTVGDKEYHHILDPQTGYPVETDVLGVTLEGALGTSGDCDALSTICLALGSESGAELVEKLEGYEAVFVLRDGSVVSTSGASFTPSQ